MEEIAAKLGISKHTLYRRYPNRQALLEAVVEPDLVRFRRRLPTQRGQGDAPLAVLRDMAFSYFRFGTDGIIPLSICRLPPRPCFPCHCGKVGGRGRVLHWSPSCRRSNRLRPRASSCRGLP